MQYHIFLNRNNAVNNYTCGKSSVIHYANEQRRCIKDILTNHAENKKPGQPNHCSA